jgi:hypothetical protein
MESSDSCKVHSTVVGARVWPCRLLRQAISRVGAISIGCWRHDSRQQQKQKIYTPVLVITCVTAYRWGWRLQAHQDGRAVNIEISIFDVRVTVLSAGAGIKCVCVVLR